ncbi:M24 family metallopeptidase [Paenibacillus camelliae]|uniref:M24 family metallopeptidase n=1 Tax=Paenibacillus camelliae TaxID=512410 RepID=UPI00203B44CD|nr:Xaa-Pro peptidase family protein [Paenibacillus camelliae]MCM3634741.1 Xaa-Pro peptidase family protein [Paenibacillus camelliae]
MDNTWVNRKKKLETYMQEQQLDGMLITSPTNVYYLTNFDSDPHERFLAYYMNSGGEEWLFVPQLDLQAAKQESNVASIIGIEDGVNPYDVLLRTMKQEPARLGIEKGIMTVARYEQLIKALDHPICIDLVDALLSLRIIKSNEEIMKVQRAVDIVEQVMGAAAKLAAVGVSELELAAEIEYQMRKQGADRPAFETMVLFGARSALPHGKPSGAKLQRGDFVLIDIGVQAAGYCSDITRTFVMGEPTEEQKRIYHTVLAANEAAIAASRSGITFAELDQVARALIVEAGYGALFTHRLGHGFGMEVHEQPSVSAGNNKQVKAGMLFTVEPGIYHPTIGGVRIEDNIYIAESGEAKVLTSYPKHLIQLGQ